MAEPTHDAQPRRRLCRRAFMGGLAGAAAALVARSAGAQAPEVDRAGPVRFFRIGTGGAGGTYFPIGRMLASAISNPPGSRPCDKGGSCGVPGLIAVAQSTQGSVENLALMQAKRVEAALCQADIAHWAFKGTGLYEAKGAMTSLRAVASLFREPVHVVIRRDDRIEAIDDLKGKRVGLGEEFSGTRVDARLVLAAHGVQEKDIEPRFLRTGAAADALRDGSLDAFFFIAGYPVSAIEELARRTPIRLLPVVPPPANLLRATGPFFVDTTIPEGTYEGVPAVATVSVSALFVVDAELPDQLVHAITKALWHPSARRLFDAGHPEARNIQLQSARQGVAIPFHPGAEAYYDEVKLAK
ncbi:TAXI family TRAP transporter solute-binding subunit [Stella sp.]|uniref:TAXI family TRAP transporter solute-binding subunit n=1 Tax=Stella sp. TaxID=2912054 RepID=UPI0035ADA40E